MYGLWGGQTSSNRREGLDTSSLLRKDQLKEGALPLRDSKAFGDLTNVSRASDGVHGAGSGKSLSLTVSSQQQKLQAASFSDPSLIDAASSRHADRGRRDWVDVDRLNAEDPQACSAYAVAICEHLREAELLRRPNPKYLEQFQGEINAKMRAILVDWLVEVTEEYKLCADTLYQAINYLDRFMSVHRAQRSHLQLVGVTCMWVAAKYEEIYPPNVQDFTYITDNTYEREQLLEMEEVVLKKLEYQLTVPTAKTFLRRLLQVCNPDEHLHFLSNYLTELSLLDYNMLGFIPSMIAASGVFLANLMLKRQPWDGNLRHYSMYVPADLAACVAALSALHQAVSSSQSLGSIREKYAHPKFQSVSRIPTLPILPNMFA